MAELITFFSNSLVSTILLGYIVVLWVSLTAWTAMDIFSRTNNWLLRLGGILLVGLGFFFGFVLYLIIRPQTTIEDAKVRELEERILESQTRSAACPRCNEILREDFLFCANCGLAVKKECPKCQSKLGVDWNQCPFCGIQVGVPTLPQIKETPVLVSKTNGSLLGSFSRIFSSPVVAPVEVKRGRGRPRKIVDSSVVVIKRGRGRPRKNAPV